MADTLINTVITPRAPYTGINFQSALFKKRWVYHTLFWLLYYIAICLVIAFGLYGIHELRFFLKMLLFFPFEIGLVYFNIYFLIPKLLNRGNTIFYLLALLASIWAIATAESYLRHITTRPGSVFAAMATFDFKNILGIFINLFYLVGFAAGIKFLKATIESQQLIKEREKQYLETELNFLKSQIQPHFFFNTLNNLYSLTLKKSDQAPEVVLKLSALMSYMLYESNTAKVPLSKEINYLQNYLDVEKLRFGQRLDVSLTVEGETENKFVPPMILILFIENSFKHGVRNNIHKAKIDISLKVQDDFLFFRVENPATNQATPKESSGSAENNGIGLKNGRRRLDLLYGNNYELDLELANNIFTASLKIPVC